MLYFAEISTTGLDNVPRQGPVIFAANHPNSIMDSLLLGAQTRRTVSFLARSGLFNNPAVGKLLDSCGVIPIYRRGDAGGGAPGANRDAFRKAYERLGDLSEWLGVWPDREPKH